MKKQSTKVVFIICLLVSYFFSLTVVDANEKQLPPTSERVAEELLPSLLNSSSMDFDKIGIQSTREYFESLVGSTLLPSDPEVEVYDVYIENPDSGEKDIRMRIYKPVDKVDNMPGIYWIHGGGFLFGVPEQDEAQSIRFAKEVGAVVVAVDYRLAPEHPYPAPLDDSYVGLVWFFEKAESLGVDKNKIAIAGSSAGGNLCAAVTLMARDKGGPELVFQMPLYPMIDDRFITPSSHEEIDIRVWNNTSNLYAWRTYLGDNFGSDKVTKYMAPARETDLSGLPPVYTCVGNLDPFRDDTINYVARLVQAGVPVEFHLYPGAFHAFEIISPESPMSKYAVDEYVRVLKKHLN